jgi:hypothetical protein
MHDILHVKSVTYLVRLILHNIRHFSVNKSQVNTATISDSNVVTPFLTTGGGSRGTWKFSRRGRGGSEITGRKADSDYFLLGGGDIQSYFF